MKYQTASGKLTSNGKLIPEFINETSKWLGVDRDKVRLVVDTYIYPRKTKHLTRREVVFFRDLFIKVMPIMPTQHDYEAYMRYCDTPSTHNQIYYNGVMFATILL